jgi:solute carrier family 8 (sodium/calcium exchanger)
MLLFAQNVYNVADYIGKADITVCRENGSSGPLNCKVVIEDGSAKQGQHFDMPKEDDLNLEFKSGETKKTVSIPLKDHDDLSALNTKFTMSLSGDAVDPDHSSALVYIVDGNINETVSQVARLMEVSEHCCDKFDFAISLNIFLLSLSLSRSLAVQNNAALFGVSSSSWGQQFKSAMALAGGEDEEVSTMDCVMHFLTFGWKVLFATVPPTEYGNGWLAFAVALTYIGGLTAVVGEVATIFGCSLGLPKAITAITFVALGTSLPDTFASKAAAQGEDSADAAVGNVTGSNAVNVFLGLGVPWVIGSCYCKALPNDPACSADGAGNFMMLAGALNFSVLVFTICTVVCLGTLIVRRYTCGGEIGGPAPARWATFGLFIGLWVIYIIMSSLCSLPGVLHSVVPACTP